MALTAILDIDGTLVDTNYPHTMAWQRAFRSRGRAVPAWRIHRHIGMGGDQLVPSVTDDDFEAEHGDDVRETQSSLFEDLLSDVDVLPGAAELIGWLAEAGHTVVLASSAREDEVEHHLDLLEVRDVVAGWTTSADVEATKPEPDLVKAALAKVDADPEQAVLIGDTTWDCEAAGRAGVPTIGVLSGGFSNEELREAGATQVFRDPEDLLARIAETAFGAQTAD